MNRKVIKGAWRALAGWACLMLPAGAALGQTGQPMAAGVEHPAPSVRETIPALFLSDIHFEPFWDPGKVGQLAAAPASGWSAILSAPAPADREQRFAALQDSCHARAEDTSYPLLESSLAAMRRDAAGEKFAILSGDLIAHSFDCKFKTLFPHSSPGDYRAFVEKTVAFVIDELDRSFVGAPVYVALGNNDSDCGDYRLDTHSEFLSATAPEIVKGLPLADRQDAQESFAAGGYYSAALPTPLQDVRLLVLDDLYMAKTYATCSGKADSAGADTQLAWLAQRLAEARSKNEKVWVMGHIPPGVDVHATMTKMRDICGGKSPEMFLSSEKMADVLIEYSDVVELAIFAHTHMDETHILEADDGAPGDEAGKSSPQKSVAVKMVPSISPIDGNNPSFIVARIDPSSAELKDYRVFAASNKTGVDATWSEEYDFAKTYRESEFSAASVGKLIAGFEADPGVRTDLSRAYIENFLAGTGSPLLGLVWPQYACSMANHSAEGFRACVCPAGR